MLEYEIQIAVDVGVHEPFEPLRAVAIRNDVSCEHKSFIEKIQEEHDSWRQETNILLVISVLLRVFVRVERLVLVEPAVHMCQTNTFTYIRRLRIEINRNWYSESKQL